MRKKWITISSDRYVCPYCNSEFMGRNTRTENWPFCPVCALPLCGFTDLPKPGNAVEHFAMIKTPSFKAEAFA